MIHLMIFLITGFQLRGERSCLFTTSISQATKTYMLPTTLGVPEDMSYRSVLALEAQVFINNCSHHDLKAFH